MKDHITRDYIINFMFMINGPGPLGAKVRQLNQAVEEIRSVTASNLYASDCLITWAKTMGFFDDSRFMQCVNARLTGDPYHDDTMRGTIWRKHLVLWAAHHCLDIDGDYAELGCYEGDTARMVVDYTNFGTTKKTYWLYDVFDNDGSISEKRPAHSATLYAHTLEKFKDIGNVKIIKGFVPQSFAEGVPEKIALLHIDLNNAPSERSVLEILYPKVSAGGIIILDDYGWVQNRPQKDTIDEFLAMHNKKVLEVPTGQGFLIK